MTPGSGGQPDPGERRHAAKRTGGRPGRIDLGADPDFHDHRGGKAKRLVATGKVKRRSTNRGQKLR